MKCLFLAVFIFLTFTQVSLAEKIIFPTGDLPPYEYKKDGQIVGMNIEIINEICNRLDVQPEFIQMPWKRTLKAIKDGDASAIFGLHYNSERTQFLYYSPEPTFVMKQVAFVKKNRRLKMASLKDLKGRRVGVIREYSYGPEFDNYKGLDKDFCNNSEQLSRLLHKERVDVILDFEAPFRFFSKKHGFQDEIKLAFVVTEDYLYAGFSKHLGIKGKVLAEAFSKTLHQMREEGSLKKIMSTYQ